MLVNSFYREYFQPVHADSDIEGQLTHKFLYHQDFILAETTLPGKHAYLSLVGAASTTRGAIR
jgi:hypothetical protein